MKTLKRSNADRCVKKYYFDTGIWLDMIEERHPHCECAIDLMAKIVLRNDILVLSDLNIKELADLGYSMELIRSIVQDLKITTHRAHHNRMQLEEIQRVEQRIDIPRKDILHAIIARDNHAILVSRDRHFKRIIHISRASIPENLE